MKSPLIATVLFASQALALFSVYEDMFASPKFLVRYDTNDESTLSEAIELSQMSNNNSYEFLRASDGTQYICQIPTAEEEDEYTPMLEDALSSKLNGYSVEIFKALKDGLLFSNGGGYWTYVLNSQKELAQFNGGPKEYADPNTYKFILGRGNERIDFPKLEVGKRNGVVYLAHVMDNGSICDVTGKPRTVEIQYVCDPSHGNPALLWVKELRTCHYQAQVSLPFLCEDELLKQREGNYNEILCTKIVDAKTRDTIRDSKKVFNHRERINIMDYRLISVEEQLFIGHLNGNASIIIDTSDGSSDFYGRLIRSFIKSFPRHFITSPLLQQHLSRTMDFKYHANVYDKSGHFIRSSCLEAVYNEKHQLVLSPSDSKRDFTIENSNIEPLHISPHSEQSTQKSETNTEPTEDQTREGVMNVDIMEGVQMETLMGAMAGSDDDIIVMKFKKGPNGELDLINVGTEPTAADAAEQNLVDDENMNVHDEL